MNATFQNHAPENPSRQITFFQRRPPRVNAHQSIAHTYPSNVLYHTPTRDGGQKRPRERNRIKGLSLARDVIFESGPRIKAKPRGFDHRSCAVGVNPREISDSTKHLTDGGRLYRRESMNVYVYRTMIDA